MLTSISLNKKLSEFLFVKKFRHLQSTRIVYVNNRKF